MQVVDDLLDFTQTAEQLGKPRYQDIESGNLTAPTLFAMKKSPELLELLENEFVEEGALERAVHLVESNGGALLNVPTFQWCETTLCFLDVVACFYCGREVLWSCVCLLSGVKFPAVCPSM